MFHLLLILFTLNFLIQLKEPQTLWTIMTRIRSINFYINLTFCLSTTTNHTHETVLFLSCHFLILLDIDG